MRLKVFVMPSTWSQTPQHPSSTNLQRVSSDEMKKKYIIQFITVLFSDTLKYDKCLTLFGRVQCWDLFVRSHFKTIIYDQHTPHAYISSHSSHKRCRSLVQKTLCQYENGSWSWVEVGIKLLQLRLTAKKTSHAWLYTSLANIKTRDFENDIYHVTFPPHNVCVTWRQSLGSKWIRWSGRNCSVDFVWYLWNGRKFHIRANIIYEQ